MIYYRKQVDDAYHFVLRHIDMGAEIEGEYRKDVYELPISAIREMIVNAVLHRSYLDKSCVQVCIYDDRMEVSSPGMLLWRIGFRNCQIRKVYM